MKNEEDLIIGYCRISTPHQNIERQERNILEKYPNAIIFKEVYTGTKINERKVWNKVYMLVRKECARKNITIVYDSVSRMSRNAADGFKLYKELYELGVSLVFLKEPHIDTNTYKEQLSKQIKLNVNTGDNATNELMESIAKALNKYIMALAEKQILLAFEQSEKEVADLHKRTSEGMLTAKLNGKQIGRITGKKYETQKSKIAKEKIMKISKSFNGTLSDKECIELLKISRNSFYKYKAELKGKIWGLDDE